MKYFKLIMAIFTIIATSASLSAQKNLSEKGIDTQVLNLRQSVQLTETNKAELKDFNLQISRLEAAFEDNDLKSIQLIQNNLIEAIKREIAQSQTQAKPTSTQKQRKILDEIEDYDFSNHQSSKAHAQENLNLLKRFAMGMEAEIAVAEKMLDEERKQLRGKKKKNSN